MSSVAKVVIDLALNREFDYLIPDDLSASIVVGSRVVVPFGRGRRQGYVVGLATGSVHTGLKTGLSASEGEPYVSSQVLKLVEWMSDYYCTPIERVIRTVLPGAVRRKGAGFKQRLTVSLCDEAPGVEGERRPQAATSAKQQAVLDLLQERGAMLLSDLTRELGITAAPVKALDRKGAVRVDSANVARNPLANRRMLRTEPLTLMDQQADALAMVETCLCRAAAAVGPAPAPRVVMVYGVTGSGKTEVYLQAIDRVLKAGRGAIVLVPEISLTPQTVERFLSRFGERIAVLHSHLSDGERHDEWHRIRNGEADIVIGARSAVFAPLRNLGLIVVDEEHEHSYKQEDAPRYNARDVAVMRAHIEGCAVVLGSATPSLESWVNARSGKYALSRLPLRADNRQMPKMRVVDMRLEAEQSGRTSVFSRDLLEGIARRLERAEQTILFLNRRGYSTSIICPKCGYVARCENCSVSLTYHRQSESLHCHICGGRQRVPAACPGCADPSFKFSGVGTQRVETVIAKCFPKARIQRIDADMTVRKDAYDRILGDFRTGKTDILIGTQMIAKGLHFPNVTLVGVVHADLSLHLPDFRAGERTFQLLAQVAGRAGRGEVPGEVIVQTYTPFHAAVQAARRVDFDGFADQELAFRRELSYPPFTHLVCIEVKGPSESKAAYCAQMLGRRLAARMPDSARIADATPAPLARAKGLYRYQIIVRCPSVKAMTGPIRDVVGEFKTPRDVSVSIDVDALSIL